MVVVTGIRGYLGSLIYEKLKKDGKHTVVGISRQDVNLEDAEAVKKFFQTQNEIEKIETVVHCACAGNSATPEDDFSIIPSNIKMMQNILSSIDSNVRLILTSSGAMRNRNFPSHVKVEDHLILPTDAYGLSKYLCCQMTLNLPNVLGIVIYGLFGETEPEYRFFKSVITNALRGDPVYVHDATSIMDFEYTPNLVNFISDAVADKSLQDLWFAAFRPERASLYEHALRITGKCYAYKQILISNGALTESNPYYATDISLVDFSDRYKPKFNSSYISTDLNHISSDFITYYASLKNNMIAGEKLLSMDEGIDEMIRKLAPTVLGITL